VTEKDTASPFARDTEYLATSEEFLQFRMLLRRLNGIAMTLRDPAGRPLHEGIDNMVGSPLCTLIRSTPEGNRRCDACDQHYLKRAVEEQKSIRYRCHAGIVDFAVPITIEGRHVASISSGQVLPSPHNEKDAEKLVRRLKWLDVAPGKIRKAYWQAPYLPEEKLQAMAELLSFFARYLCEANLTLQQAIARLRRPEILAAQDYVNVHFADNVRLAQVAGHVGLSPIHLSMLFHRETGMTFTHYLQQRRATQAARLLPDRRQSITDICFACGFNSLTHMNRVFRKFYKCSPLQYRQKAPSSSRKP